MTTKMVTHSYTMGYAPLDQTAILSTVPTVGSIHRKRARKDGLTALLCDTKHLGVCAPPLAPLAPSAKKSPPATLPSPPGSSIAPEAFVRSVSPRARASSHTPGLGRGAFGMCLVCHW